MHVGSVYFPQCNINTIQFILSFPSLSFTWVGNIFRFVRWFKVSLISLNLNICRLLLCIYTVGLKMTSAITSATYNTSAYALYIIIICISQNYIKKSIYGAPCLYNQFTFKGFFLKIIIFEVNRNKMWCLK